MEAVSSEGHVFPVQGASIQVAGTGANAPNFTATTSENGAYKLENLPQGEYTLTASAPGFKSTSMKLTIQGGQATVENIRLGIEVLRQQIEVRATAPVTTVGNVAPPAKLSAQQVETVPVAEQKTQQELPLIPGVIRTPEGRTCINGLDESAGMFKIDRA